MKYILQTLAVSIIMLFMYPRLVLYRLWHAKKHSEHDEILADYREMVWSTVYRTTGYRMTRPQTMTWIKIALVVVVVGSIVLFTVNSIYWDWNPNPSVTIK
jgi:hypothetical protein